jgi:hypothetical protein
MAIFSVKFPNGRETTAHAETEEQALSKAFHAATQPIYCRIHEGIAETSNAPVGEMGLYFPPSAYPVSARRMREVYMDGGYCLVPADPVVRAWGSNPDLIDCNWENRITKALG